MARILAIAALILLSLAPLYVQVAEAQLEPPVSFEITGTTRVVINETGTATVEEEIKFSASAFTQFRQMYNPLSTFIRELTPRSMPLQMEDLEVDLDEANNKLKASYKLLGIAEYVGGGKWIVKVGEPRQLTLSTQNGNTFVFTKTYMASSGVRIIETITVELPEGAQNPVYQEDEGVITYQMPLETQDGAATTRYIGLGLAAVGAGVIGASLIQSRRQQGEVVEGT